MTVKIEKGIAIPSPRGRKRIYPFGAMGVGDSFEVPVNKRNSVSSCVVYWTKKNPGMKFVTRYVDAKTVRIWRVE